MERACSYARAAPRGLAGAASASALPAATAPLSLGVPWDALTVPLDAPTMLLSMTSPCLSELAVSASSAAVTGLPLLPALAANGAVFVLGAPLLLRNLDYQAYAGSFVLGLSALAAFGPAGYGVVCLYFVVGAAVTKLKIKQKAAEVRCAAMLVCALGTARPAFDVVAAWCAREGS